MKLKDWFWEIKNKCCNCVWNKETEINANCQECLRNYEIDVKKEISKAVEETLKEYR